MIATITWRCDNCGVQQHTETTNLSDTISRHIPNGWKRFSQPTRVFCTTDCLTQWNDMLRERRRARIARATT